VALNQRNERLCASDEGTFFAGYYFHAMRRKPAKAQMRAPRPCALQRREPVAFRRINALHRAIPDLKQKYKAWNAKARKQSFNVQ
jgi:hypothetical protein